MQSDKEEESTSLLLLLGSALLRPCSGKPGTPRHQLHVSVVASVCQLSVPATGVQNDNGSQKPLKRGLSSSSSSSCPLPRCKDADHFTHKEQAKHSHQGNHCRDGAGVSGLTGCLQWITGLRQPMTPQLVCVLLSQLEDRL